MKLLSIEGLNVRVKDSEKEILSKLNFDLKENSIHTVFGSSGSGKSTFLKILLNLVPENIQVNSKSWSLFNKEKNEYSEEDWVRLRGKQMFLIPQNPIHSFHPYFEVETQIKDFFKIKKMKFSRKEFIDILNSLNVQSPSEKIQSRAAKISGGERQRILIALAIQVGAKVLLADEPTSALDSVSTKSVLSSLYNTFEKHKLSIVLITHDRKIAKELSNEISILYRGEIIENQISRLGNFQFQTEYAQELMYD
ncbi:MAG: ATP-binding cassette domain-containing protein [Leptospiraceae bacterium]|nr:ATP-binding cassette domain-containing protein [Leptospiraceae bacterium]